MGAGDLLTAALVSGRVVWGADVSGQTWPEAARTYLGDGTGIAWNVPDELRQQVRFAIDAEIIAPVRPTLTARYGIDDPRAFTRAWTRAEVLAKLFDVPIITWLRRHGLEVPVHARDLARRGHLAWHMDEGLGGSHVITHRAVLVTADAGS